MAKNQGNSVLQIITLQIISQFFRKLGLNLKGLELLQ